MGSYAWWVKTTIKSMQVLLVLTLLLACEPISTPQEPVTKEEKQSIRDITNNLEELEGSIVSVRGEYAHLFGIGSTMVECPSGSITSAIVKDQEGYKLWVCLSEHRAPATGDTITVEGVLTHVPGRGGGQDGWAIVEE